MQPGLYLAHFPYLTLSLLGVSLESVTPLSAFLVMTIFEISFCLKLVRPSPSRFRYLVGKPPKRTIFLACGNRFLLSPFTKVAIVLFLRIIAPFRSFCSKILERLSAHFPCLIAKEQQGFARSRSSRYLQPA